MYKWMPCQDGYIYLTIGTVQEEGQRRANKVRIRAHMCIMFACIGVDQGGLTGHVVMHACNNRGCMNPAHMLVGSTQQNMGEDNSSIPTDRQRCVEDRAAAIG